MHDPFSYPLPPREKAKKQRKIESKSLTYYSYSFCYWNKKQRKTNISTRGQKIIIIVKRVKSSAKNLKRFGDFYKKKLDSSLRRLKRLEIFLRFLADDLAQKQQKNNLIDLCQVHGINNLIATLQLHITMCLSSHNYLGICIGNCRGLKYVLFDIVFIITCTNNSYFEKWKCIIFCQKA